MPTAPARPCARHGCPAMAVPGSSRCAAHTVAQRQSVDDRRGSSSQRGYGVRWQRIRNAFIRAHPVCADPYQLHAQWPCVATDVDHIIPRRRGGTDDEGNLQALCHACHSRKTATDDERWGRGD